jgi:hypothetical protein
MAAYAEAARSMLWAIESAQVMLELNRRLLDLGLDMLRRQQDAVITAAVQSLGGPTERDRVPAAEAGFAELARMGFEAFERMVATMRAANDPARWTIARDPEAERWPAPRL